MMAQNYVNIPLIFRASVSAHANDLAGIDVNGCDSEEWNIEDWHRVRWERLAHALYMTKVGTAMRDSGIAAAPFPALEHHQSNGPAPRDPVSVVPEEFAWDPTSCAAS